MGIRLKKLIMAAPCGPGVVVEVLPSLGLCHCYVGKRPGDITLAVTPAGLLTLGGRPLLTLPAPPLTPGPAGPYTELADHWHARLLLRPGGRPRGHLAGPAGSTNPGFH